MVKKLIVSVSLPLSFAHSPFPRCISALPNVYCVCANLNANIYCGLKTNCKGDTCTSCQGIIILHFKSF